MVNEWYDTWKTFPWFLKEMDVEQPSIEGALQEELGQRPCTTLVRQHLLERFAQFYFNEAPELCGYRMRQFKTFPRALLHCTFIRVLDLSWHDLETLPDDIHRLERLEILDLSQNTKLTQLPPTLARLEQLHTLLLTGNTHVFKQCHADGTITYPLPAFFRKMRHLRTLNLFDVLLDGFPAWLDTLTQLEQVQLSNPYADRMPFHWPVNLKQWPQLQILEINDYTTAMPQGMDQMQALEYLAVDHALAVPEDIQHLKQLKTLDLSHLALDYKIHLDGCEVLSDLKQKGVPAGMSRLEIYGWEWLKTMTQLKELMFVHEAPYAFTDLEKEELAEALPHCAFVYEEHFRV